MTLELSQFYVARRFSDIRDTYANSIGALLGAIASLTLDAAERIPFVARIKRNPFPILLLLAFLSVHLYPYIPVIDLHKYVSALQSVLAFNVPAPDELVLKVVIWMVVYFILQKVFGLVYALPAFAGIAVIFFGGEIVTYADQVDVGELSGAMIAVPLLFALLRLVARPTASLAIIFTDAVIFERLQPFVCRPYSHGFG